VQDYSRKLFQAELPRDRGYPGFGD